MHKELTNVTRPSRNGTPRRVGWSSGNRRSARFTTWKRRSPRIRTVTPTSVACSGKIALGGADLLLLFRHDWFIPYVTPLALHRTSLNHQTRKKKKNSHPNAGGVFAPTFPFACFLAHAPVNAVGVLTGGPFFVSTHVDDPNTGAGALGGGGFTLTGRGRQRGLLVMSSGGTGHQCVVG